MKIKITYQDLVKMLQKNGFVTSKKIGSHLVLVNEKYQSKIVFPVSHKNEIVKPYILLSIRKNLVEKGVLTEEKFTELFTSKK
jgi:predicted RNA binding protein YcfA (HicA-like mRNA interferase family)